MLCVMVTAHDATSTPELKTIVAALLEQKASYPLVVGDGKIACKILGCGPSQLANKRRAGEIASFLDGAKRVYPVGSLFDHLIAKAAASFSPDGKPLKARDPVGQFRKGHIPRRKHSPAQLKALRAISRARVRKTGATRRPVRRTKEA
jgi:hypothetical protein